MAELSYSIFFGSNNVSIIDNHVLTLLDYPLLLSHIPSINSSKEFTVCRFPFKKINLPNVFISLPMVTKIEKYFKPEMPYPIFLCNYTFLSGETKTYSLISLCLFGNQLCKTQQYDKEITKPQIQEMCNSMNIWTKENLSPNQVSL